MKSTQGDGANAGLPSGGSMSSVTPRSESTRVGKSAYISKPAMFMSVSVSGRVGSTLIRDFHHVSYRSTARATNKAHRFSRILLRVRRFLLRSFSAALGSGPPFSFVFSFSGRPLRTGSTGPARASHKPQRPSVKPTSSFIHWMANRSFRWARHGSTVGSAGKLVKLRFSNAAVKLAVSSSPGGAWAWAMAGGGSSTCASRAEAS